jgi:hypothetical protein
VTYEEFARNGLILGEAVRPYVTDRSLRRDIATGTLLRLRRGAYVEARRWAELSAQERHILRIQAVVAQSNRTIVICGRSAAALWGMPVKGGWSDDVDTLTTWDGGGRSDKGIRRTAAGASTARTVSIRNVRVTDLARTALDIARANTFTDAIGSLDWAISRSNANAVTAEDLADDLRRLQPRVGGAHLQRLVAFASPLSDSFYESAARAAMHLLGFAPPELQATLSDGQGEIIPDFMWRSARQVGEFDGKVKYTRNQYTKGDPGEVAWKEKKREDRIRRLEFGVVRILTEHVENPAKLEKLLVDARVPRAALR